MAAAGPGRRDPLAHRTYEVGRCVSFRRTREQFGGLSNMAAGYPLRVNDVPIRTSEHLYQALRFTAHPDVQALVLGEASPMTAKMRSRASHDRTRPDWSRVRVRIMRWCLRVKLAQNWEKFAALLAATGDLPIVECSRRDEFWGARVRAGHPSLMTGSNVLGRLLMELRGELRGPGRDALRIVDPPAIPRALLLGRPIEPVVGTGESGSTYAGPRQLGLAGR